MRAEYAFSGATVLHPPCHCVAGRLQQALLIYMHPLDDEQHHRPHIHARYAEHEAVYDIDTGNTLAGSLPRPQARLVEAWIELRRQELLADWTIAINGQPPFRMDPLR